LGIGVDGRKRLKAGVARLLPKVAAPGSDLVLYRGNHRADIFRTEKAEAAVLKCCVPEARSRRGLRPIAANHAAAAPAGSVVPTLAGKAVGLVRHRGLQAHVAAADFQVNGGQPKGVRF